MECLLPFSSKQNDHSPREVVQKYFANFLCLGYKRAKLKESLVNKNQRFLFFMVLGLLCCIVIVAVLVLEI
jgi:hypothetical protein